LTSWPTLVADDGTQVEFPDELYEVLKDGVTALSQGLAITVAPQHTVLTTSQAEDLLGSPARHWSGCSKRGRSHSTSSLVIGASG